jgi:hypothetical protein
MVFGLITSPVLAHVPFFEQTDYTEQRPFKVKDSIENSKAIYAWFETDDDINILHRSGPDIDVYAFEVTEPVRVRANALVPVCSGYEVLLPWFAVVGPGLPEIGEELPFTLPEDYGAIVVPNLDPDEPRDIFFEPFGAKDYYDGPSFDQQVSEPGTWYLYYWDPLEVGGDYVAAIGNNETFSFIDTLRALIITPLIRANTELHTECP